MRSPFVLQQSTPDVATPFVRQLLHNRAAAELARNSYRNYHTEGLDYLCLLRSPALTVKAYFFREDLATNGRGWMVWPHNHRYAFEHLTLCGVIRHFRFRVSTGREAPLDPWWLHLYNPEVRAATPVMQCEVEGGAPEILGPGMHFRMEPDVIHTLTVDPGFSAIALQLQYADQRGPTVLVAPEREVVECGGNAALYLGVTEPLANRWREELLAVLPDLEADA